MAYLLAYRYTVVIDIGVDLEVVETSLEEKDQQPDVKKNVQIPSNHFILSKIITMTKEYVCYRNTIGKCIVQNSQVTCERKRIDGLT